MCLCLVPFLKATNSSFQKGIAFCRSIYVKKAACIHILTALVLVLLVILCTCLYLFESKVFLNHRVS